MDFGYVNGHEIIKPGSVDSSPTVKLCSKAVASFDSMQQGLSRTYYLKDWHIDEAIKKANNLIKNVNVDNTLEAIALAVTLDKIRIMGSVYDKHLDVVGEELRERYTPLIDRYILTTIPGSSKPN